MLYRLLLCFLLLLSPVAQARETPAPSIAMHGQPKYGADFTQLDYANPTAPKGGTLRLAMTGSFDSVNPYSVRGNRATGSTLAAESLMGRSWDEPFSLYGLIAQSITTPADRSWAEFTLNPKAHWNDGTPITVEDVLFSYQTLREKGRPNHRTYYSKVSKAEITGKNSIRFTFAANNEGDREMPLIMGLMPVLCKAWWQGKDITAPLLEIPVTSGPYKLTELDPGRRLVYQRDENYWGRDLPFNRGQWNFDRITYDYYRDDGVALEAFKAGAYDLRRETDPVKWLSGYQGISQSIVRLEEPNSRTEPLRGLIFNTRRAPFDDIRVREALTHALDFEWMNRALFGGIYRRASSTFPNSELANTGLPTGLELNVLEQWRPALLPRLFTSPFTLPQSDASGPGGMRANLRKAVDLLRSAGFELRDGVMQRKGEPLAFEILLTDPRDQKIALEFARSLQRLGITAHLRTADSAQYQSRTNDFDYDMTINFWSSTLSPGNEQIYYWGSAAAGQPGSRNYAGVSSPVVDAMAKSIASAASREDLVAHARALDRVLMWGYYVIPLYYLGRDLMAYQADLQHPSFTPAYGLLPEQTWWWKSK